MHGQDSLVQAMAASGALFGGEISGLTDRDLEDIFADVPSFSIEKDAIEQRAEAAGFAGPRVELAKCRKAKRRG